MGVRQPIGERALLPEDHHLDETKGRDLHGRHYGALGLRIMMVDPAILHGVGQLLYGRGRHRRQVKTSDSRRESALHLLLMKNIRDPVRLQGVLCYGNIVHVLRSTFALEALFRDLVSANKKAHQNAGRRLLRGRRHQPAIWHKSQVQVPDVPRRLLISPV